ncbi:hypothetical protein GOP47_0003587 [Adiantum capillus-veneris]|uniref:DUF4005 domain-containing protein n=1 Tax=Adiantum capillus-veneris TaxID=13818 RepID=A0A9D4V6E4_ADICA|nr:hypothetical protein GOP47_0003587 [Adiantum capillus-veneris]
MASWGKLHFRGPTVVSCSSSNVMPLLSGDLSNSWKHRRQQGKLVDGNEGCIKIAISCMLDTSFELDEKSGQPRRTSGRRSHEINVNNGTPETKQVQRSTNMSNSISNTSNKNSNKNNNNGNNNLAKSPNKLQMQSRSVTTINSSNKKLQSPRAQLVQAGGVNSIRGNVSSNIRPVMRHKGDIKAQEDHNSRHARAVAAASAAAAEAAAVAAQAAAEVMRLTGYSSTPHGQYSPPLDDFSLDDFFIASQAQRAATLIQSAYRGHLARQALRALKGLVKLQAVVRGHLVRRQARISLQCMQALVRLQARVRARQVKAALQLAAAAEEQGQGQGLMLPPAFLQPLPTNITSQLQETPSHHHRRLSPFCNETSARSPALSEDSRDWDNSALSKEEIEMKALKKQHALALRQKALSYAENNQRTPTRSIGTPTRRMPSEYYQAQQQKTNKSSFHEAEPEKLHRDWSWLEGWMAAHGATSVWESNAAALWESRDERRDRDDEDDPMMYGHMYGSHHELADVEYEDNASHSLLHDLINSDDDPAIKIIEMDRVGTPPASRSPYSSSMTLQHLNNTHQHHHHHHAMSSSRLHHVASPHLQPSNLLL